MGTVYGTRIQPNGVVTAYYQDETQVVVWWKGLAMGCVKDDDGWPGWDMDQANQED